MSEEFSKYKDELEKLKRIIDEKNIQILERLESEEQTLIQLKNLLYEYNSLEAKYHHVSNKYHLLKNSKLGRLTLGYWKYRRRIPDDY